MCPKKKQRRPSCLLCCFSTYQSLIAQDLGGSEAPSVTTVASDDGRKDRVTCFSWSWFRRKKGLPKTPDNMPKSTPTFEARIVNEAKIKVNRCRSLPLRLESTAGDCQVNTRFSNPVLPQLSPKCQTRNRTELRRSITAPNRRHHAQFEQERVASTPLQVNIQDRMKRDKILGPKSGLTVIGVTLAVTVFYGRTAAVVSLFACLYLVAFLRPPAFSGDVEEKISSARDAKVGSKEYKKRVVMEGFLTRSKIKRAGIVSAFER